jgi:chorismate dehydratase
VIFGSICYLNLLPFQVYLKKRLSSTQQKQIIRWHRAVPSTINEKLKKGVVNSAFISSIHSKNYPCTNLGIVADGPVYSVFVIDGKSRLDRASATSNILAKVLNLEGEVLIGDRALRYYLDGGKGADLALEWKKKTKLPFVFARLCYNQKGKKIKKIIKSFNTKGWKIPQYILKKEALKKGITPKELRWYLKFIKYEIGSKEQKALNLFLKKSKRLKKV